MVRQAPHAKEALEFLQYLLTDGQKFLIDAGFIPMSHPLVRPSEFSLLPQELKAIVKSLKGTNL